MSLNINITYDSSVASAPAGFRTAVNAAVGFFEQAFTNPITINLTFGWGQVNGSPIGGNALAENISYLDGYYSYSQIKAALSSNSRSVDDSTAVSSLPINDPTHGGNFALTTAEAKALGLQAASGSIDAYVGLNSSVSWTFDPNHRAVANAFDSIGALEHEISETMGRIGDLGQHGFYTPIDLYRYASPGVRSLAPGPGSFSLNGTQLLQSYNDPRNGGDAADWLSSVKGDSYGSGYPGVAAVVSPTDMREMDILGYDLAPIDTPPVVTAANVTTSTRHGSIAASSLFNATDPDGDTITRYDLLNTGAGGGHFVLAGVAQGANQDIYVTPAQLSQTTYQVGSTTDTLQVRAFDGTQWGAWSNSFSVTPPVDTPPVVQVTNFAASKRQGPISAASLFTASDPDGDAITQYDFWNTGTGGGHFSLNGVTQTANHDVYVTAAQLTQTTYQAGSASDTLWVRAFDGANWSAWSNSFTVTVPVDTPPIVTVANIATSKGQHSIAASSLFTASDSDGDTLASYDFWNTGNGGGQFLLNGVPQGANHDITVTAAQLAQTTYQVGSAADSLWVRAFDGTNWSSWSNSFTVSPPVDTAPTVSVANVTGSKGQNFAASSLFTATDLDGDAIAGYDLWNTGSGGGHFVVNGISQGTKQDVYLTPAQLAQTTYQLGSTPDTLWARASDGTLWSPWSKAFTVAGTSTARRLTANDHSNQSVSRAAVTGNAGSDLANLGLLINYMASSFVELGHGASDTARFAQPHDVGLLTLLAHR
jgi:hypothetical protein